MRFRPGIPLLVATLVVVVTFAVMWPLRLERPRSVIDGRPSQFVFPSFAPDGRSLITSELGVTPTAKCRDAATNEVRWFWECRNEDRFCFSPDGQQLTLAKFDGKVEIRDVVSGQVQKRLKIPERPTYLAFAPDGSLIYLDAQRSALRYAVGNEPVYSWDGRDYGRLAGGDLFVSIEGVEENDKLPRSFQYRFIHIPTGKQWRSPVVEAPVRSHFPRLWEYTCSRDGHVLAALVATPDRSDTRWQVMNTETGETRELISACSDSVVTLSPDGEVAAINEDRSQPGAVGRDGWLALVRRWLGREDAPVKWLSLRRVSTGQEIASLPGGYTVFAPDGRTLAVGGDGYLELWDYPLRPAWLLRLSLAAAVGVITWSLLRWRRRRVPAADAARLA